MFVKLACNVSIEDIYFLFVITTIIIIDGLYYSIPFKITEKSTTTFHLS